jgi:hypothetical protein
MTTNDEQLHIRACLEAIEAKLHWGSAANWGNGDFQKLAGLIADATGVALSVSTLKRLWGKVSYNHTPSLTTLDALAQYLGYADWRAWQQPFRPVVTLAGMETSGEPVAPTLSMQPGADAQPGTDALPAPVRTTSRRKRLAYIIGGTVLLLALIGFISVRRKASPDASQFSFSLSKVKATGVPNTVVFTYDATAATTDSVFIVQTWDIRRKTLVAKDQHAHSAIYYYPGFFRTRLIVDGTVVQRQNLQISTDGWLGLVENEPVPLYFNKAEFTKSDRIEVDTNTLGSYGLSLYPQAPKVRFFNQRDLGNLQSDRFTFETKVKNDFSRGTGACQYVQVLIQCKNDIIIIPLAAPTCTGDLELIACGAFVNSKQADLSKFGADLSQWVTLRVESQNKQMQFFVNGALAYSVNFPGEPTGIVGLQYRFDGVGAVKDTWFKDGEKVYDFGPGEVR